MYRCEKHGGCGFQSDCEICQAEKWLTEKDKHIATLEAQLAEAQATFKRMEDAWRSELESWYRGKPNNPSSPSLLASLNRKLKKTENKNAPSRPRTPDYRRNLVD